MGGVGGGVGKCAGVGVGKGRCVGSGEVWESVWGEWGSVLGWVARGFATWKIRHTTNVIENLSVTVGQTFATVPMWKIRHTTVIDWGGGLGRESWGFGVGGGVEVGGSGLGGSQFSPTPQPNPPTSTPLTPTLLTQPITVVWQIFRIGTVANVCPTLTLKFSVTFVCLTRCVANLLCGESSGNRCGVGGGQGSCGKRYGGCRGRCREMCWGVGGGKERCVGSGEVW